MNQIASVEGCKPFPIYICAVRVRFKRRIPKRILIQKKCVDVISALMLIQKEGAYAQFYGE